MIAEHQNFVTPIPKTEGEEHASLAGPDNELNSLEKELAQVKTAEKVTDLNKDNNYISSSQVVIPKSKKPALRVSLTAGNTTTQSFGLQEHNYNYYTAENELTPAYQDPQILSTNKSSETQDDQGP